MKKTVVALFAHPDDECFGPGGTLALFAKTHDVYVIVVTRGEAGELHEECMADDLGVHRQHETETSATALGIRQTFFLNFKDGTLCNHMYHAVAAEVEKILKEVAPEILITFEPRGFSGHVDHMFVSAVTTYLYEKLPFVQKLLYFCIDEKQRRKIPTYFIHFPPGYKISQIDEIIDVSPVWEQKMAAIHAHKSQQNDIDFYLPMLEASGKKENFLVLQKE